MISYLIFACIRYKTSSGINVTAKGCSPDISRHMQTLGAHVYRRHQLHMMMFITLSTIH